MDEKKNLEIVSGDGSNLNISPAYDNPNVTKPKTNKPTNIVVPKIKKSKNKKDSTVKNEY